MDIKQYDLSAFPEDARHFARVELLLTVKSFDLEAIRKRYLASRRRSKSGSVERRQPSAGGLVHLVVENGRIVHADVLAELMEPRGVDIHASLAAVSSEDKVYVFDRDGGAPLVIEHPWLSYIHTVRFNSDGRRLLVSSSGVDTLLQFEVATGDVLWEWVAWEHGLNRGENPETGEGHVLTRHAREAEDLRRAGENPLLITEPKKQRLPTALRAAFMNSAEYADDRTVLATLFHHGCVIEISPDSSWRTLIDGLSKPHGGMRYGTGYLVTDTGGGRVVCESENARTAYDFARLPGKAESVKDLEWIQFSRFKDDVVVALDSNRAAMVFIDTLEKKCMSVRYDGNWALQEFAFLPETSWDLLGTMKAWFAAQGLSPSGM